MARLDWLTRCCGPRGNRQANNSQQVSRESTGLLQTRGWIAGTDDSLARQSLRRATLFMQRLPPHERSVIRAYQAFYDRNYATARTLYQQLLARDSADPDAWYGLGETWFHDTVGGGGSPAQRPWKRGLRFSMNAVRPSR